LYWEYFGETYLRAGVSAIEGVVFKMEGAHLRFVEATPNLTDRVSAMLFQVAWAF
jgi:hypothetical protein